jgi:hypothetical protein
MSIKLIFVPSTTLECSLCCWDYETFEPENDEGVCESYSGEAEESDGRNEEAA